MRPLFIRLKTWGVDRRALEVMTEKHYANGLQNAFFVIIFDIYYATLKIVAYDMFYTDIHHWYKFYYSLSSFRLIWVFELN